MLENMLLFLLAKKAGISDAVVSARRYAVVSAAVSFVENRFF